MGKETYCELLFFLMPFKAEIEILNLCYKTFQKVRTFASCFS